MRSNVTKVFTVIVYKNATVPMENAAQRPVNVFALLDGKVRLKKKS